MSNAGKGHKRNQPSNGYQMEENSSEEDHQYQGHEEEGIDIDFEHPLLDHFLERADKLGQDHDQHTSQAVQRIEEYEKTQESYMGLVKDNDAVHDDRRNITLELQKNTEEFDEYSKDSAQTKRDMRAEFDNLEDALRKLKDQISETEIENKNLQLIAETEQSIQDAKDRAEQDAVKAVNKDLKELVNRLSTDADADISYQEVSDRIKTDVETNYSSSHGAFDSFIEQTELARNELSEDLTELKERVKQRNQDNDDLRGKIEEGELEIDRLNGVIEDLGKNMKGSNNEHLKNLEKERKENENAISNLRNQAEDLRAEHTKLEVSIMKINSQLKYLDEAGQSGGNDLIRKKVDKFDSSIKSTERSTEQLKSQLNGMNQDWINRIDSANREIASIIRDSENKESSEKIKQLLKELQEKQSEIEELKRKRNQLERDLASSDPEGTDREIQGIRSELEQVNEQLISVLRENNKNEVARLRMELEAARIEQEEKGSFFQDLYIQIDERRQLLGELQDEVGTNEQILQQLEETLHLRRSEGAELDSLLVSKDDEIRKLEARLRELNKNRPQTPEEVEVEEDEPLRAAPLEKMESYTAKKGDEVDELLAQYINYNTCPVPITRLGGGYYMFGTKKIYAKVMNGRLVVRVGGGYMVIDKFIETYAEQELIKMQNRVAKGLDPVPDLSEHSPSNRSFGSPRNTSPGFSPNARTMKTRQARSPQSNRKDLEYSTSAGSAINGTMRKKKYSQINMEKMIETGAAKDYRSPKASTLRR